MASSEASFRMRLIVGFLEENWPAVDMVAFCVVSEEESVGVKIGRLMFYGDGIMFAGSGVTLK